MRLMLVASAAVLVLASCTSDTSTSEQEEPASPTGPTAATPVAEPVPDDAEVHGWPGPTRNPAGIYSWDASPDRFFPGRTRGFVHNGYRPGSGDVYIVVQGVPGRLVPHRGQTAGTVAGFDGTYRRYIGDDGYWAGIAEGGPVQEWMVDIQGTTVTFLLIAKPGVPEIEVAEAHEIIESIRMQPKDNDLGFRLLFTLTTNTWDSG